MGTSRKRRLAGIACLALCLFLTSPANAWEFSMTGAFTWEFYQFSQLGDKGFFGPYNQDNSTPSPPALGTLRLAARNGWLGHEIASRTPASYGDNLASGSDVAANYMYTTFTPIVKVNEALSIGGIYRIGSWLDPSANFSPGHLNSSRYLNSTAPGIGQSFSPGYWQVWCAAAQLPWGTVAIGKQPNTIGLGLIIDSLENASEAVGLSIPFGPFQFIGQYYPWAPGNTVYPLITDRSGAANPHFAAGLSYNAGNLSTLTYVEYTNGHKGPESELFVTPPPPAVGTVVTPVFATDSSTVFGITNFRYCNGQFFCNAEVGYYQAIFRQNGFVLNTPSPPQSSYPQTRYWELWAGMVECGAVAGPAKVSFLWAYYPGPDRRAGKLIDRQPTVFALWSPNGGVNLYLPYSLLLGYDYGSGNMSISRSSNHGFITDASTYGVRLDYAVAANLNAYATFLYASRISQGYGWGWIRPDPFTVFAAVNGTIPSPGLTFADNGTNFPSPIADSNIVNPCYATSAPNILERDLGYEIGGGIDWKLIEGYTLAARVAYWKPGGWFKYACVDRRQPNWDNPDATNRWGINPNREIDPIFGMRICVTAEF